MAKAPAARWFDQKRESAWTDVIGIARGLRQDQAGRETRAIASLSTFEGRKLSGLNPYAYFKAPACEDLEWNVSRSLAQTVQAKVAGLQRPKPQFIVTDADWKTKRRAKRLDRFVEGQLHQRQGTYESAWDMGVDVFLDAAVVGTGVIKVYSDTDEKKVCLERVYQQELFVDPLEARNGNPLNLFHIYPYDRDKLIARFPKFEKEIRDAQSADDEFREATGKSYYGDQRRVAEQVVVYESWRLPLSSKKPGKHAICINGATLEWEDWERDEFPFVFLRWTKERMGFGATSLVEEVETIAQEIHRSINSIREAEKLNCTLIDCEEDQYDDEALESNEHFTVLKRKPGSPPVNIVTPNSFSESTLQWLKMNIEQAFAIPGISQMAAKSEKPSGVTAAIAMRTLNDLQSERFSVISEQYQNMYVALARHIVACTRELAEEDKNFAVRWPGGKFLRDIKWSDADLDEDMYTVRAEPVSGLVMSASHRYSTAQDLYNAGVIGADAFLRMIDMGDVERETNRLNAQNEYIEQLIDRYLDADEGDEDFEYESPEPFIIPELAIAQMGQAYLEAKMDRAPEFNTKLLRTYITESDKAIQNKMAKMAELQAKQQAQAAGVASPTPQVAPTAAPPASTPMAA